MTDTDDSTVTRRSKAVGLSSFVDVPERLEEWFRDLPSRTQIRDTHTLVDKKSYDVGWAEPQLSPLPTPAPSNHRVGTCFENESREMRAACVDTIGELIGANDAVIHEARHQQSGYHTDLVYADIRPSKLQQRDRAVVSADPIHDPLQRFRVWWHLVERGPEPRQKAIENGRYADPEKNRRHLEWLLDHGYVARTSTDHVDAVVPPAIADLHAVELKLRDWSTALDQADRANRCDGSDSWPRTWRTRYGYADYRWVALDAGAISPALEHRDEFVDRGVGLLAVSEGGSVSKLIDADNDPRDAYTRDRAYLESQVWNRVDREQFLDDLANEPQAQDADVQPSLAAFGDTTS